MITHSARSQAVFFIITLGLVFSGTNSFVCLAAETNEQVAFFEKHVRPLLVEHCFRCHSGKNSKGGLRVDGRGYLLLGGESGPAIDPGASEKSLLIEAVRYESFEMPPTGKLADQQIEILQKWIDMGAPWPGDDGQVARRTKEGEFSEEDRQWWAFQPVADPVPPETQISSQWARNPIDQFIAAGMEQHQLHPAPEADRGTLIRRLYFNLLGLPPSPEAVRQFEQDPDPEAYDKLVDELLNRPEYGQRWGRHWLDLVRYAESDGYRADLYRPQAWRYRDYVIQSFNDDKPYDRFVREQLAGDELYPDDPAALVATGFLRHGILEYNVPDVRGQWDNILNEVTDVTGDVFFGLGFQCARCHDHKFDPILQKDYFRLRAFFEAMLPHDDLPAATPEQLAQYETQNKIYLEKTQEIRERLDEALKKPLERVFESTIKRYPDDILAIIRKPDSERTAYEKQLMQFIMRLVRYEQDRVDGRLKAEEKEKVLALRRELAKFDSLKPAPLPCPMTVRDVGPEAPATTIPKKNMDVTPGFLTILSPEDAEITPPDGRSDTTGRRSALALWLTDPKNPLSTRVIVNRVWQFHFGRGLASNASDFGRLGDTPSHPELLDWLTSRFIEEGWRLKELHRLIVTSATYRQSAYHPQRESFEQIDPSNRQYWRGDVRRLDAEQIRDAIFAVTGQLDLSAGGPGTLPDRPRRSIYTRVLRNSRDPLLEAFDLPFFMSSSSSRDTTTSPIQSLLLMNSQTMIKHAENLAKYVTAKTSASQGDLTERIRQLWWTVLGREPGLDEIQQARQFLSQQEAFRVNASKSGSAPVQLATGKVPYRDGQAILFQDGQDKDQLLVPPKTEMNVDDFTIEAHLQVRSIYSGGEVRTIIAKTSPEAPRSGWMFGITGKASRRKPQTLVLQIFGKDARGSAQEAVLFSDHHLELNKPYYVAVSVRLAKGNEPGTATFYLKDLSNEEEPVMTAEAPVSLTSINTNDAALTIGSRGQRDWRFDGLIDDIRLSNAALQAEELLLTGERTHPATIGYWKFEPNPGIFHNSLPGGPPLVTRNQNQYASPAEAAFIDLCHVLLNSNEFLYID